MIIMIIKLAFLLILLLNSLFIYAQNDTLYYATGQIEAIGKFENAKKQGEWRWFYKNGQTMSIENYINGKFQDGRFWDETGDSITINEILVQPNYPNGGMDGFNQFITNNLQYPTVALRKKIQGQVIVDFNINRNGELVDFKIIKSVHESLDNEAIRVIKESGMWIPGTFHGEKVKIAMRFPINFIL